MAGHQPTVGEQVGFLVTAGDARNNGPTILKERSNVVVVPFPSASGASFTLSAASLHFVNRRVTQVLGSQSLDQSPLPVEEGHVRIIKGDDANGRVVGGLGRIPVRVHPIDGGL